MSIISAASEAGGHAVGSEIALEVGRRNFWRLNPPPADSFVRVTRPGTANWEKAGNAANHRFARPKTNGNNTAGSVLSRREMVLGPGRAAKPSVVPEVDPFTQASQALQRAATSAQRNVETWADVHLAPPQVNTRVLEEVFGIDPAAYHALPHDMRANLAAAVNKAAKLPGDTLGRGKVLVDWCVTGTLPEDVEKLLAGPEPGLGARARQWASSAFQLRRGDDEISKETLTWALNKDGNYKPGRRILTLEQEDLNLLREARALSDQYVAKISSVSQEAYEHQLGLTQEAFHRILADLPSAKHRMALMDTLDALVKEDTQLAKAIADVGEYPPADLVDRLALDDKHCKLSHTIGEVLAGVPMNADARVALTLTLRQHRFPIGDQLPSLRNALGDY